MIIFKFYDKITNNNPLNPLAFVLRKSKYFTRVFLGSCGSW